MTHSYFLIFVVGFMSFMFSMNNYLMMLLSMEMMMLSIYMMISLSINFSMDYLMIFMSMMIMEGIFGLSLLLSVSHSFGKDQLIN